MNSRPAFAIALALGLVACGKPAAIPDQPVTNAMFGMVMPSAEGVKGATGAGTITAIDSAGGKVTFAHGPVTELRWPAMTMNFSATPKQLDGFAIGDKVAFSFDWDGKTGRLVSIARQ